MFNATVTLHQLAQWLPPGPATVLDVSRPLPDADPLEWDSRLNEVLVAGGHRPFTVGRDPSQLVGAGLARPDVIADPRSLEWVRDASVDAVIAEGGALSDCLAAEATLAQMHRVVRPGGRVLASADSLTKGLATLAEQHRWSELADAPAADVVLVPDPEHDDALTRCFAPDDLRELLEAAGFDVEWIRPRTVLPAAAVRQTLQADPEALGDLVVSELTLARAHEGESHGAQLLISGIKRP